MSCECCTFSPLLSGERDFIVSVGAELAANYGFFADYPDVHFTPLRRARALPGGSIEPGFYDGFKQKLLEELATHAPWDGIFLDVHGAANVYGRDDVEGDMLAAIRKVVGADCLILAKSGNAQAIYRLRRTVKNAPGTPAAQAAQNVLTEIGLS